MTLYAMASRRLLRDNGGVLSARPGRAVINLKSVLLDTGAPEDGLLLKVLKLTPTSVRTMYPCRRRRRRRRAAASVGRGT